MFRYISITYGYYRTSRNDRARAERRERRKRATKVDSCALGHLEAEGFPDRRTYVGAARDGQPTLLPSRLPRWPGAMKTGELPWLTRFNHLRYDG